MIARQRNDDDGEDRRRSQPHPPSRLGRRAVQRGLFLQMRGGRENGAEALAAGFEVIEDLGARLGIEAAGGEEREGLVGRALGAGHGVQCASATKV